jgi:hypothetical protein
MSDETRSQGNISRSYPQAGLIYLQGIKARAALRTAQFKSRPAHSDQLNLDLWWHESNIIQDRGSYSYNAPSPWENPFSGAASHNAPVIDGADPMQRAGTFLWLNWVQARVLIQLRSMTGQLELVAAEHDGYQNQGIGVRRTILRAGDDLWLVVDDLFGSGQHTCQLNWTLPDWQWSVDDECLSLRSKAGAFRLKTRVENARQSLFRGGESLVKEGHQNLDPTQGWVSPTYHALKPALSWQIRVNSQFPMRICTWLSFNDADLGQLEVQYHPLKSELPAIRSIGFAQERWVINKE